MITQRRLEGIAYRLTPDSTDAESILPARCRMSEPTPNSRSLFCDKRPDLTAKLGPGDVLLTSGRFGSGSVGRPEVRALLETGLAAVIARTFDRRFYRSAAELGLFVLINAEAADALPEGHRVRIDLETGLVHDVSTGEWYRSRAPLKSLRQTLDSLALGNPRPLVAARGSEPL